MPHLADYRSLAYLTSSHTIIGIPANIAMLYLTVFKTPETFKIYSKILCISALCDLIGACILPTLIPRDIFFKEADVLDFHGFCTFASVKSCWYYTGVIEMLIALNDSLICVSFYHRLKVINGQQPTLKRTYLTIFIVILLHAPLCFGYIEAFRKSHNIISYSDDAGLVRELRNLTHYAVIKFADPLTLSILSLKFQLLPEMTLFGECACILSIGIERLTAVLFIAWYKKICRKTFLTVYFAWILVFSFYPAYLMIAYFEPGRHICSVPAPFHGAAGEKWVRALTAVNLTTAVTYCVVAVAISRRAGVSPAMRQAFRCVFIVMVFDVGGWAMCNGFLTIAFALDVTAETQFILLWVAGIFVNFGLAAKASIYYTVSTEYRSAFKSLFYRIVGKTMITRSTATVTESTRHMF